MSSGAGAGVTF